MCLFSGLFSTFILKHYSISYQYSEFTKYSHSTIFFLFRHQLAQLYKVQRTQSTQAWFTGVLPSEKQMEYILRTWFLVSKSFSWQFSFRYFYIFHVSFVRTSWFRTDLKAYHLALIFNIHHICTLLHSMQTEAINIRTQSTQSKSENHSWRINNWFSVGF